MKVQAIVPAAGTGTRLKSRQDKPFIFLKGKPLIVHTLSVLEKCSAIESIILVTHARQIKNFQKLIGTYRFLKIKQIVPGGHTRCASVQNGLKALDRDTDVVLVHDGARPLISSELLKASITLMRREQAVVVAVPVKPTIKMVHAKSFYIEKTLPRETLWEAQTPQVFRKDILMKAHAKMLCADPTDDAVLVEQMGIKVKILRGDYTNIKVTTREDLAIVKNLLP